MNVLLTGATGFVGNRLAKALINNGYKLSILTRRPDRQFPEEVTIIPWNSIQDTTQLFDVCIHNGAPVPKTKKEDVEETMNQYVQETKKLYDSLNHRVKHIIFISTAEVYELSLKPEPISEETVVNPRSEYAKAKITGELLSLTIGKLYRIPATVLRLSVLYGPGDMIQRAVPNFIHSALKNEPIAVQNPRALRDYLHVDDAAKGIVLAVTSSYHGIINLGTGKGISIEDTAHLVKDMSHSSSEVLVEKTDNPPMHLILEIEKAKNILGFSPEYYFPDRLEEEISWIRDRSSSTV